MAKPKKVSPKPAPQELYRIALNLGGDITEATGTTPLEALRALPKPEKIMTKASVTVSRGDNVHIQIYNIPRLKRLFYSNPTMQEIQAKQLALSLK